MLAFLSGFIIHLIQSLGYFGVFILMTLESALIPIPSEVTLPFAGFLAQKGTFSLFYVIIIATVGDIVGTMVAYAIGYFLEETVIVGFIEKYGKFILLSKHEYTKVMGWFAKKGNIIITISKLLPGFRTIIGLPAGLSEIPLFKVIIYTAIGSAIWCTGFVYIGYILGKNWNSLHPIFQKFEIVIVAAGVLAILWYINHKLKIVKFKK
jgi:membrane protein DedA with SNARE-associated domain